MFNTRAVEFWTLLEVQLLGNDQELRFGYSLIKKGRGNVKLIVELLLKSFESVIVLLFTLVTFRVMQRKIRILLGRGGITKPGGQPIIAGLAFTIIV